MASRPPDTSPDDPTEAEQDWTFMKRVARRDPDRGLW